MFQHVPTKGQVLVSIIRVVYIYVYLEEFQVVFYSLIPQAPAAE